MQASDGSNPADVTKSLVLLSLVSEFPAFAPFYLGGRCARIVADRHPRSLIAGDAYSDSLWLAILDDVHRHIAANSDRSKGAAEVGKGIDCNTVERDEILAGV